MFNPDHVEEKRKVFFSNPPLPEQPRVVPAERNGVVYNKVIYEPGDNHSYFEGVHYSSESMSLRAKLNLGVPMTKVSFGALENDPAVLNAKALTIEKTILNRLSELQNPQESQESQSNS